MNIRLQGREEQYLVGLFKVKTGTIGNVELMKWRLEMGEWGGYRYASTTSIGKIP